MSRARYPALWALPVASSASLSHSSSGVAARVEVKVEPALDGPADEVHQRVAAPPVSLRQRFEIAQPPLSQQQRRRVAIGEG